MEFYEEKDAEEAVREFDRTMLDGNEITVIVAQDRRKSVRRLVLPCDYTIPKKYLLRFAATLLLHSLLAAALPPPSPPNISMHMLSAAVWISWTCSYDAAAGDHEAPYKPEAK